MECDAARHNLLECLKTGGKLELENRSRALSEVKDEIRKLRMAGQMIPLVNSDDVIKEMTRDAEKAGTGREKEQIQLLADFFKGGKLGEKALDHMAEEEYQARLEAARVESERRKADFLKKIRSLHQKQLELTDAEAEYKATK